MKDKINEEIKKIRKKERKMIAEQVIEKSLKRAQEANIDKVNLYYVAYINARDMDGEIIWHEEVDSKEYFKNYDRPKLIYRFRDGSKLIIEGTIEGTRLEIE